MLKKGIGVLLIIIGFLALVTPFTPGALLMLIVGTELLEVRIVFLNKIKVWLQKHESQQVKIKRIVLFIIIILILIFFILPFVVTGKGVRSLFNSETHEL